MLLSDSLNHSIEKMECVTGKRETKQREKADFCFLWLASLCRLYSLDTHGPLSHSKVFAARIGIPEQRKSQRPAGSCFYVNVGICTSGTPFVVCYCRTYDKAVRVVGGGQKGSQPPQLGLRCIQELSLYHRLGVSIWKNRKKTTHKTDCASARLRYRELVMGGNGGRPARGYLVSIEMESKDKWKNTRIKE